MGDPAFSAKFLRSFFILSWLILVSSSARAGNHGYQLVATMTDNDGPLTCLTFDATRNLIIHGDASGKLYFRDANTGQLFRKINAHGAPVQELTFNSNGNLLVSASQDGEIKIYDFSKDAIVQSLYSPDYSGVNLALFSIADGFIYFNSVNRIYKTRSDFSQKVSLVADEKEPIADAAISADRGTFLYANGKTLKTINTRTDQVKQEVQLTSAAIYGIRFVNDTVLAVWCKDGTLSMHRFSDGTLSAEPYQWMKAGPPGDMCFSRDGSLMVSGNVGNWARVIRPQEKQVVQELFGHKGLVTTAVFGANEGVLFTGSKDGSLRIWKNPKIAPVDPISPLTTVQKEAIAQETTPTSSAQSAEKNTTAVTSTPAPPTPEVSLNEENTPILIGGRQVIQAATIHISTPVLTIYVFDNSTIDG
ncbi:MAG: telomerase protein component 1 isoform, partial [Bacteroidota bacterium]